MTPYETIVMTAKPHGSGFCADLRRGYDKAAQCPLLTRAWWSRHPVTNDKPTPVWPVKTEA